MMKNFKKMTCLLLVIALVFSLISCAKAPEDIEPTDGSIVEEIPNETEPAEEAEDPTAAADTDEEDVPAETPSDNEVPSGNKNDNDKPAPVDPNPGKPADPKPTEPKATEPKPTEPKATEPKPTEPKATEPKPTEPAAHTHKYTDKVVAPTCTEKGYTLHTCSCGHSYKDKETAAKGHNWGAWVTTKAATTSKEGEQKRTCSTCKVSETRKVEKLTPEPTVHTHKYTDKVVAPTCTEKGYTLHTCSCGHSYKDKETAAKGHSWGAWTTSKEATTEAEGEEKRTCSACRISETRKTDPIPTEAPTEPPAEVIDCAALAAYGRSYGASAYGFAANSGCYAGYYPAVTANFSTMEEGKAAVRSAVSTTASRLLAYGPVWGELEDGTIWRASINVQVSHNGGNSYTIWVYYG